MYGNNTGSHGGYHASSSSNNWKDSSRAFRSFYPRYRRLLLESNIFGHQLDFGSQHRNLRSKSRVHFGRPTTQARAPDNSRRLYGVCGPHPDIYTSGSTRLLSRTRSFTFLISLTQSPQN